jgi:hypothetical protein
MPPGAVRSMMKSDAEVELSFQFKLMLSVPPAVATRFDGAEGTAVPTTSRPHPEKPQSRTMGATISGRRKIRMSQSIIICG